MARVHASSLCIPKTSPQSALRSGPSLAQSGGSDSPDVSVTTPSIGPQTLMREPWGLGPENEAQAALAVNAACLHAACTNVLSRLQPGGGDRRMVNLATAVARLERAFQGAVETFYRVKRGNKQVIRVEKIEIQPGAQAIVGQVSRG